MAASGVVVPFSPSLHLHLVPYIAAIHAACVTHDRTIATFLPPLSHDKLLSWWKDRVEEVRAGSRLAYVLLSHLTPGTRPEGPDVMGVVMLSMPWSETGPFRGIVQKLLVHKSFRGRGGARQLVAALEEDARRCGRTLLVSGVQNTLRDRGALNTILPAAPRHRDREPRGGGLQAIGLH